MNERKSVRLSLQHQPTILRSPLSCPHDSAPTHRARISFVSGFDSRTYHRGFGPLRFAGPVDSTRRIHRNTPLPHPRSSLCKVKDIRKHSLDAPNIDIHSWRRLHPRHPLGRRLRDHPRLYDPHIHQQIWHSSAKYPPGPAIHSASHLRMCTIAVRSAIDGRHSPSIPQRTQTRTVSGEVALESHTEHIEVEVSHCFINRKMRTPLTNYVPNTISITKDTKDSSLS